MDASCEPHRTGGIRCSGPLFPGVVLRPLQVNADSRGSFTEVFTDLWGLPIAPRQFSLVRSTRGSFRGMHLHQRHDEYFLLLEGQCTLGLHDLRPDSPTRGQGLTLWLSGSVPTVVAFPRGIVHGWLFPTDAVHLQAVSEPYAEYGDDDNHGCHYLDPELGIDWDHPVTSLSDRAAAFGPLRALRARMQSTD